MPSGEDKAEDFDFEQQDIDAVCTIPELVDQVLGTANLDGLPSSNRHVDNQSDGYESEEDGYSRPMYLPMPFSQSGMASTV